MSDNMEKNVIDTSEITMEMLVDEVNDYKDKYYRVSAELENTKKRLERDKHQAIEYAIEKFAHDIVENMDVFEKALETSMPDDIRIGIDLIYKNFKKTLNKFNITEIHHNSFDPNIHQAISKGDGDEITNIYKKGYMIKDKLLRPSIVAIGI